MNELLPVSEWLAENVETLIAILSLWLLAYQVGVSVRQSKYNEALLHIRDVRAALQRVRGFNADIVRRELTESYENHSEPTEGAALYLELLDALDLLALAYKRGAVNRRIIREYLRPLIINQQTVPLSFLHSLRRLSREPTDYEHIEYLVRELESTRLRRAVRACRALPARLGRVLGQGQRAGQAR